MIKQEVVESIITAARNVYPDEFFSMLGGKNKIIEELVVVQAEFGREHSSFRHDLVPFDKTIIGTIHSHPNTDNDPSEADLEIFRKIGEVHIIICYPYTLNTIKAFDNKGRQVKLRVV